MVNIVVAFITGLTTGGLSCLAVQGGLLASSLAGQIENEVSASGHKGGKRKRAAVKPQGNHPAKLADPIIVFLTAKLFAYTVLGFLLGLLGQMFQLSVYARAFLQIGIGIFMLGTALRMLNVHPIFRYFVIEPPAFIRRKIRRSASGAGDSSLATPAFLGLLTVLIPCGVTQAMMAVALGTADPIEGAALMFAFTLGTSPVFFAVAYFTTQLGARLEKHFMRFVAIVILVLAVVTIDSGVTLAGSPVSFTRLYSRLAYRPPASSTPLPASQTEPSQIAEPITSAPADPTQAPTPTPVGVTDNLVTINVTDYGYEPGEVHAKADVPVQLRLVTNNTRSCSRAFYIPSLNVQEILAATGEVIIDLPAQPKGTKMQYSCSMGMFGGTIIFDL